MLTVDLVVWRQQSDVRERDSTGVAVIKLHRDQIVIFINIWTSCLSKNKVLKSMKFTSYLTLT